MIETLPNDAKINIVRYYPDVSAICEISGTPFCGTFHIEFRPKERLLEFMSFDDWLKSLYNEPFTIESLARRVFDVLTATLGDIPLRVELDARTTVHAPVSAVIERD